MQLGVTLALAVVLFVAFSIGLNLGLHGVLTLGDQTRLVRNTVQEHKNPTPPFELVNSEPKLSDFMKLATTSVDSPTKDRALKSIEMDRIDRGTQINLAHENKNDQIFHTAEPTMGPIKAPEASTTTASMREYLVQHPSNGAISQYIRTGSKIPILLLTCNRPELLELTIKSLLEVRGIDASNIIVSQDGVMQEVSEIILSHNIRLVQNTDGVHLRGGVVFYGGQRIAMHYKFSISKAFEVLHDAPAIIVVEDDLLFSPDFYEYFESVAPILEADPSTFVISAWNDNGFKGKVNDPHALRRTEFFPGLGWLLPRALYKGELERQWPSEHWDHWLRSKPIHKGREVIHPQVPRSFHNGVKGTFMNVDTHNKYFRDIDYNRATSISWSGASDSADNNGSSNGDGDGNKGIPIPYYISAAQSVYEARIQELISKCIHVRTVPQLMSEKGVLCAWLSVRPEPRFSGTPPEFQPIAEFFGVWHEHQRGNHKGLHEFVWNEHAYVLLINVHEDIRSSKREFGVQDNSYYTLKPHNAVLLDPQTFDKKILIESKRKSLGLDGTPAMNAGESCDVVCSAKGLQCRSDLLYLLNTCPAMLEHFPCRECVTSIGMEQPAFVVPEAGQEHGPGQCLVSSRIEESRSCASAHEATRR